VVAALHSLDFGDYAAAAAAAAEELEEDRKAVAKKKRRKKVRSLPRGAVFAGGGTLHAARPVARSAPRLARLPWGGAGPGSRAALS
jgi:hypothetical protein